MAAVSPRMAAQPVPAVEPLRDLAVRIAQRKRRMFRMRILRSEAAGR